MFKHKQNIPKIFSFGPFCKKNNFPRNYIFRTIRWHKPQVPDKLQNSYKNYQKTHFWAQNGPKLPPGAGPRGQPKFLHSLWHLHFSIVYGSITFKVWVFVILDFTWKKPYLFWGTILWKENMGQNNFNKPQKFPNFIEVFCCCMTRARNKK